MRFMPTADTRLEGIRVLVTRPAAQAEGLMRRIREAGGKPVPFPTLEIEPVAPAPAQVEELARSGIVIFVSRNAVVHGYPILRAVDDARRRIIAVGQATRRALEDMGCQDVYTPAGNRGSSEELLASPALQDVAGRAVCIVRGPGGRELMKEQLTSRGARVSYLECYRRRRPVETDTGILVRTLEDRHGALVVSITSITGLAHLLEMTPASRRNDLLGRPLVVIGRRQRTAALAKGWTGPVLEAGAGDADIVETIAGWCEQS
jgi:uroporphyrinogen-III synthase